MNKQRTLSLDAMGGDDAPDIVVRGVRLAHKRFPNVRFLLFGDESKLRPLLNSARELDGVCEVRHCEDVITNDAKPSQALRSGKKSSMWLAIQAVAEGEAEGVVSAGNTGALMAMAKLALRTLPGIDRPAIATMFPTIRGESVMLDLGANVECDARNLAEFAVMGEVFARTVLGIERPSVALLNIGSEEVKGKDAVRDAAQVLRHSPLPLDFKGFVEGDGIAAGEVDVIVTDGFTGNVALKTAEGTARLYSHFLKGAFRSSFLSRLGYVLARHALSKVRLKTDPRRYNGAMFLGLNGICVKSHGGTDALGFSNAVAVAVDLTANEFNEKIKQDFEGLSFDVSAADGNGSPSFQEDKD